MEERETHARRRAGGRASARVRWVSFAGVSAVILAFAASATPAWADVTVEARDDVFVDATVEIYQGESVTWTQAGNRPHNVVFDLGTFPTYPTNPTASDWTSPARQFNATGTFRYYCFAHGGPNGGGMSGTVTVLTPPAGPPPGGGNPPPGGGNPPGGGSNPPGGGSGSGGGSGGSGGGGGGSQPGSPSPGTPGAGKSSTAVTLKVSDATPARGQRVRFFGTARPAQDGRLVHLQRRVGRSYRTVARIKLVDAGASRSKFSKRLRMLKDAVFRARLPANKAHAASTSRKKRVNVL
jgi:plastocyanin